MRSHHLLAILALFAVPARAACQIMRPSRIADSSRVLRVAPKLAGFRLGESLDSALARLGSGLKIDTLGGDPEDPLVSYSKVAGGVTLLGTRAHGVGVIMTSAPSSSRLDQVWIGETRAAVFARWGPPAAGGRVGALWLDGDYVVSVTFDPAGVVSKLGIGVGVTP